jgi:predicted ATP-grasp superfamily ATP-dependent carboligase
MAEMSNRVPAVVLNCEAHGGLGIVRSLGRMGVPVYPVHKDRSAPANFSRYATGTFRWDFASASDSESLAFMQRVSEEVGCPALIFACDDDTAIFVGDHAGILRQSFLFQDVPADLIADLASKRGLYELATRHNIPTAETRFPRCKADVLSCISELTFPVLLKAIDGLLLARRTGKKMVICRNEQELLESYDRLEDLRHPNLMIQEYIPGGAESVWMFNGYFNHLSECLASFTGRKLRQCPIHTGATSLGICLKNPAVEHDVKAFLAAVGYKGMVDVGTRYDARDGRYKILDVNPRIGATFRLFVDQAGMDVARACYLDMTGQAVTSSPFDEGRRWIVEDMDASASIRYWRERSLTVRQWAASLHGIQEAGYFSWSDPLPALVRLFSVARRPAAGLRREMKAPEEQRQTMPPALPTTRDMGSGL